MRTEDDSATADPRPPLSRPPRRPRAPPAATPDRSAPDLPNCRPVPLEREDLDTHDERFEYWDGDTETAWVLRDPTGFAHEHPSQRLAGLAQVIAGMRGAPIECGGTMDLELRGRHGERQRILRADQSVYLHPGRSRLPDAGGMVVGEHDYPDVVLEVDHTTDVRRWKLGMYEAWGFPEVWVEVPEGYSASRPARLRPGLTIHLREGGAYRESPESRAFPGWRAEEIHTAMNEASTSVATGQVLGRVARTLCDRGGAGAEDYGFLRTFRDEGREQGRAEGREEGRLEGLAESRGKMVRQMLVARGIAVSGGFPTGVPGFAEAPEDVLVRAALACDDEQDFRARIRRVRTTAVDRRGEGEENGSDPR